MKQMLRKVLEACVKRFGYSLVGTTRLGELTRMAAETKAAVSLETHLGRLLRHHRPDCVFDVGANDGGFAKMLRSLGYEGWIVSFEPLPALVARLTELAAQDERWRVEPYALGAAESELNFHQMAGDVFSSFLKPESGQPEKYHDSNLIVRTLRVPVKTVDGVWQEMKAWLGVRTMMLKLDTQGYDLEVFKGAARSLGEIPLLMSELACVGIYQDAPDYLAALSRYAEAGYKPAILAPISFADDLRAIEMDGVFVRETWGERGRGAAQAMHSIASA
ncbi:FkbM family methyltransferase [Prosthecobacter sp.]|uniref:FkbM family methyltransferase n=1 Tax=Prosthecobacter sp. TaxID=1965333 RepID=UPI003783BAFB